MTGDRARVAAPQPTFAQERRVRSLPDGTPAAKTVPLVCQLPGPVDLPALEDAVNAFVARHPALRHRFVHRDGQVLLDAHGLDRIRGHLTGPADVASLRRELDRPFDLTGWPLLRWGLAGGDPPRFYLSADHVVFDGWSAILAQAEVQELYRARVEGRPGALPPAGDPFAFSARERRRFPPGPGRDAAVEAFRQVLRGRDPVPAFPLEVSAWDLTAGRYTRVGLLDAASTQALEKRCRGMRATIFMGVLAGYAIAMRRCGAPPDIGLRVAVHNREEPQSWHTVGWYANTLPLYVTAGGTDFAATVVCARRALLDLLSHYDLPAACLSGPEQGVAAPAAFLSFADRRGSGDPTGGPGPDRWTRIETAPAFRPGYGVWITLDSAGLTAVTASPAGAGDTLTTFESAFVDVLRWAASG